ncbi:hypothetical protein [Halotia branconii]|uniref:Uncharacterized protein n=1 Tax=Halotia branconii CENA392 TaxID=1539056 RepID=A0AAJ6NMW2_9CYAN|nr:hypothetical protein [Halotia branconii]WGV23458.1 hypothetical protein QI031_16670 [Halotia branconii CENA392]
MHSSSLPPPDSSLPVQNLQPNLDLGNSESEIRQAISANFDPMPQADPEPDSSLYNLNAILDALD